MKRLLTLLSSLLLTFGILSAQTVSVVISGTVADGFGNGISNLPIDIFSDSTFNFIYNNQVLTDANGFYGDTIPYPDNLGFGILAVQTVNCDDTPLGELVLFETNSSLFYDVDFLYCDTISGGWPPFDSCFAFVVCEPDGGLFAEASGTAPLTFQWSNGATTPNILPQSSGLFCVTVTDANGCVTEGCSEYDLDEPCGPILFDSCYAAVTLDRGNILTAHAYGEAPFTYNWNNGETTEEITVQNTGEYCVIIEDSEGCTAQGCYYFIGGGWPPIDSCFAQVTCDPDGNLVVDAFGTAPFSYLWNTGETTQTIMPQDTGFFCVTVTDADGCVAEGCSHYVGGSGNIDTCFAFIIPDLNGLLFADILGVGPFNYMWNTGETTQFISPQNEGEYCVIIESSDGCIAETCYYYVPNGGWNDSCFAQVTCDPDGNLVADAFGTAPFSYLWNTGETTPVIMPQDTGFFCVTVTDAEGCVSEGCSHYVGGPIFNDTCSVWIVPFPGGELFADGFGATPPFTFLWNTGETTQSIYVTDSLEYCVTMTDGNGCTSSACYNGIITPPICTVTIQADGDQLFANSGNAAVIYEWSTGETTQIITATGTGLYCVSISDIDGCFAQDCYFYSDGMPNDTTCSANVEFIEDLGGYFVAATGTEPFTYLWDDGSTDPFLFTLDASIHCVTVVDANGCVAEACSGQGPVVNTENDISGYIYAADSTQFPLFVNGSVLLIDAATGTTIRTTDILNLNSFPFYNFTDVPDGEYIIRAEAVKPDGSTFIPTYHFATSLSSEADKIIIPYASTVGAWNSFDVFIFDIIRKPGQGSIAGNVTKVPGFGGTIDNGRLTLDGISIILFDESREPIQYHKTNDSGEFSFPSLAWGTYHVYIDIPGHENAFFTVMLGPDTPDVNDLNFNIYEGNITTSNGTSSVEEMDFVSQVKLFPNPTSGSTTIEITSTESGNVNLSISDVSGKIIQTQSLNISKATQRFEINLTNLNSGLYFVRLVDGSQSISKRLIIND